MSEETVTLIDPKQSYMVRGRSVPAGVPFQLPRGAADALLACGKHPGLYELTDPPKGAKVETGNGVEFDPGKGFVRAEPENGPETAQDDDAGDEPRETGNDEGGATGSDGDGDSGEAAGTDREKPEHLGFGRYLWEGQKYKKADLPPAALALLTD